jgi:hypothetical protein
LIKERPCQLPGRPMPCMHNTDRSQMMGGRRRRRRRRRLRLVPPRSSHVAFAFCATATPPQPTQGRQRSVLSDALASLGGRVANLHVRVRHVKRLCGVAAAAVLCLCVLRHCSLLSVTCACVPVTTLHVCGAARAQRVRDGAERAWVGSPLYLWSELMW